MKRTLLVFSYFFLATLLFGQNVYPIYNNCYSVGELDNSTIKNPTIAVPCDFAKSNLQFPAVRMDNKKILKVIYCYSENSENPSFEQNELSDERYEKLMEQFPALISTSITWETFAQVKCAGKPCVQELFHGFLLVYEPLRENLNEWPVQNSHFVPGHDELELQKEVIKTDQVQCMLGEKGSVIYIPKDAFVDKKGNLVSGLVELHLKEAIALEDIVLGNLETITADDQLLESKGMIEIRAFHKGEEVQLGKDKFLDVELPSTFSENFSYYQGELNEQGNLVWDNPVAFNPNNLVDEFENLGPRKFGIQTLDERQFRVIKNKEGIITSIFIPISGKNVEFLREDFSKRMGRKAGLNHRETEVVQSWFESNHVKLLELFWASYYRLGFMGRRKYYRNSRISFLPLNNVPSTNRFPLTKMGWANIDCLASFPNAKKMRFEVNNTSQGIEEISFSLIIPQKNAVINGFQKYNDNYSFTHGDYEEYALYPLGQEAYVLATGTKDGEAYSGLQKIVFGANEVEDFEFQKRDKEATKRLIKEAF